MSIALGAFFSCFRSEERKVSGLVMCYLNSAPPNGMGDLQSIIPIVKKTTKNFFAFFVGSFFPR